MTTMTTNLFNRSLELAAGVPVTAVGVIVPDAGLCVLDAQGREIALGDLTGFDHFAA